MSSFRIRPSFSHAVALSPEDARHRLLQTLTEQVKDLEVRNFPGFIGLHIPTHERRYWSPRLFLSLEATPEGTTLIHGTYGPEMEVWSVFLYGYLLSGLISIFAGILGGAQLVVHSYPWGFWVVGGMAVLATTLYVGAQLGQKLGAWQTFRLHQAYQVAIGQPAEIR
ncbi:MAG: hypothetical protein HZC55_18765 [Verrucomicrobia bacterium]|nr:hypothetical protein [Verrucomicrobiota bacterium]